VPHAPIQLVWLKRDLRMDDHRPILEACQTGPTVVLYVFEPKLWAMPEMDRSHFDFIVESLQDLSSRLCKLRGLPTLLASTRTKKLETASPTNETSELRNGLGKWESLGCSFLKTESCGL
jgi:deoxyribodipyrimidine photolyase